MNKINIVVVGAGVIGLTSAVRLQTEIPGSCVVLISDDISPYTTGDGSAGLWGPFLCGKTRASDINRWSQATHKLCRDLWKRGDAEQAGVCLIPAYRLTTVKEGYPIPEWSHIVYGCHKLSDEQLKSLGREHGIKYTGGHHFVTFTLECTMFLPYLLNEFLKNGGTFMQKRVTNLKDLSVFDIIVNCTGIGAKELIKDDDVTPIRGQVTRAAAPWIFSVILDESDDGRYIIPNMNSVVLGGTHQEGDFNKSVDLEDSKFINEGCSKIISSLKTAKIIKEWVGLRPGRNEVRLELEDINDDCCVIHNYGHGGSGVTLSWGCAGDVVRIATDYIDKKPKFAKSKL